MKSVYIKLGVAFIAIALLIFLYLRYGDFIFDQTHRIDQEVEHSMDAITTITIKNASTDMIIHTSDQKDFYAVFRGKIKATTPRAVPLLKAKQTSNTLAIEIVYSDHEILSMEAMTFDVYIPSTYIFDLDILTEKGNISLSPMTLNRLSCVSLDGDIQIKSSTVQHLLASSISGDLDVTLTKDLSTPITLNTNSGTLISDYPHAENTPYKLLTTTGDITLHKE